MFSNYFSDKLIQGQSHCAVVQDEEILVSIVFSKSKYCIYVPGKECYRRIREKVNWGLILSCISDINMTNKAVILFSYVLQNLRFYWKLLRQYLKWWLYFAQRGKTNISSIFCDDVIIAIGGSFWWKFQNQRSSNVKLDHSLDTILFR